jgi:hypothetical protein
MAKELSERAERQWFDQDQASAFLLERKGVRRKPKTLQKYRCIGGGPPFRKIAGRIVYERGPLEEWAEEQRSPLVTSTSELSTA